MTQANCSEQPIHEKWRASGAKTIWVQPVPEKPELVVLLPARPHWRGDGRWRLVLSSDHETVEQWRDSGSHESVVFPARGKWVVNVTFAADGEEYPPESFAAYYPDPSRLPA